MPDEMTTKEFSDLLIENSKITECYKELLEGTFEILNESQARINDLVKEFNEKTKKIINDRVKDLMERKVIDRDIFKPLGNREINYTVIDEPPRAKAKKGASLVCSTCGAKQIIMGDPSPDRKCSFCKVGTLIIEDEDLCKHLIPKTECGHCQAHDLLGRVQDKEGPTLFGMLLKEDPEVPEDAIVVQDGDHKIVMARNLKPDDPILDRNGDEINEGDVIRWNRRNVATWYRVIKRSGTLIGWNATETKFPKAIPPEVMRACEICGEVAREGEADEQAQLHDVFPEDFFGELPMTMTAEEDEFKCNTCGKTFDTYEDILGHYCDPQEDDRKHLDPRLLPESPLEEEDEQ